MSASRRRNHRSLVARRQAFTRARRNLQRWNVDIRVIPQGFYCYDRTGRPDGTYHVCPFWSRVKGRPEMESGYCSLMEIGDWQPGPSGLLWDQCKSCNYNDTYREKRLMLLKPLISLPLISSLRSETPFDGC